MARLPIVRENKIKHTTKSLDEKYELHMRLTKVGRVCNTKQSPTLPETLGVNVADV